MEARALAELPVVRLQRLGGAPGRRRASSTRARICSIFSKSAISIVRGEALGGELAGLAALDHQQQLADDVGPAVVDEVLGLRSRRTPAC